MASSEALWSGRPNLASAPQRLASGPDGRDVTITDAVLRAERKP